MALEVVFAVQADRDIEEILNYLAAGNPAVAEAMARRFERSIHLLAEHPQMAPLAPRTRQPGMRKLSIPPYILYYRTDDDALEIARVLHSSRELGDEGLFRG